MILKQVVAAGTFLALFINENKAKAFIYIYKNSVYFNFAAFVKLGSIIIPVCPML